MNRSDEIKEIFQNFHIPNDITIDILNYEKQIYLSEIYDEWEDIKVTYNHDLHQYHEWWGAGRCRWKFMIKKEIKKIQGDFHILQTHLSDFKKLQQEVYNETGFIRKYRNF